MPLTSIKVTNFKLEGITEDMGTFGEPTSSSWSASIPDTNTLPRACMIKLEVDPDAPPPDGETVGYWAIGTRDITISGCEGFDYGSWLTYNEVTYDEPVLYAPYSNPIRVTEFNPAGLPYGTGTPNATLDIERRIGYHFWQNALGSWPNGDGYIPSVGDEQTYYRQWVDYQVENSVYDGCDSDCADLWHDQVQKVVAVNSMPLDSNFVGQQGNVIYVIVVIHPEVYGIGAGLYGEDLETNVINWATMNIDLDGGPVWANQEHSSMPVFGQANNGQNNRITRNNNINTPIESNSDIEINIGGNIKKTTRELKNESNYDVGASINNP